MVTMGEEDAEDLPGDRDSADSQQVCFAHAEDGRL